MLAGSTSPWVGLAFYAEEDRDYFFGRERDAQIVTANLRATRLTVLYGTSGTGKSSLLLAGVVPRLRDANRAVVVFREWQIPSFLEELKRRCAEAVRPWGGELDDSLPLDELLRAAQAVLGKPMLVVLDQFDEYFTAHGAAADGDGFEPELARAVNRTDVGARFLISLREDALAGMDRFHARIPNLLGNLVRVEHLTSQAAERAIREPLRVFNEGHSTSVRIDDELVRAILADVRPRDVPHDAVEAPYLQLVLERLWEVEHQLGELRLATYEDLGRAEGIVGSHFEAILQSLQPQQRELCARFFDRLVTPSGGKIAYPLDDLKQVAAELEPEVPATLERLEDARILREVSAPGHKAIEIFHDVLAPRIVEWQQELVLQRERALARRRRVRRAGWALLAAAIVLAGLGARSYWVAGWPWASLTNVVTGRGYGLTGSQVFVGRQVPGFTAAKVSVPDRYVSRLHVLLSRDGRAFDVRSLNGSTIDARFLEYGVTNEKIRDGAVIVTGGAAVFVYRRLHHPFWRLWPTSAADQEPATGWALLIDGNGTVQALTSPKYYLVPQGAGFVATPKRSTDAVGTIWNERGSLAIRDVQDRAGWAERCAQANGEGYPLSHYADGMARYVDASCVYVFGHSRLQLVPLRGGS